MAPQPLLPRREVVRRLRPCRPAGGTRDPTGGTQESAHDTAGAQPTSATLTRPGERAGSYCSLPAVSCVSSPHPSYAKGRPSSGFQRAWGLPPIPSPGTSQHPLDHVLKGRGQAPSCGSYAEPLCAPTGFLHLSQSAQAFLFLKDASGASLGAQW